MAAIVETTCRLCGQHHGLCLANADLFTRGAIYEYTCPVIGESIQMVAPAGWGCAAATCPDGSIPLIFVRLPG
jgi:hypothetical protein